MADEWLSLRCPGCRANFKIKSAYAHMKGKCPACGFRIRPPKPREEGYVPPPVSDADEPLGLVPLDDEEWPEPGRLEREDEGLIGFATVAGQPTVPMREEPRPPAADDSGGIFRLAPDPHEKPKKPPAGPPLPVAPVLPVEPVVEVVKPPPPFSDQLFAPPAGAKPAAPPPPPPPPPPAPPPEDDLFGPAPLAPEPPRAAGPKKPPAPSIDDLLGPEIALPQPPAAVQKRAVPPPLPAIPADDPLGPPPVATPAPVTGYEFAEPPPAMMAEPVDEEGDGGDEDDGDDGDDGDDDAPPVAEFAPYALTTAERAPRRPPPPPKMPLLEGVWTFPWWPGSLRAYLWITLGVTILSLQAALIAALQSAGQLGVVGSGMVGLGMIWVFIFTAAYASTAFFGVIQDTAAGNDDIAWPEGGWKEYILPFLRLGWIGLLAGLLSFGLSLMCACFPPLAGLMVLLLFPALFPSILLSSMANDSAFNVVNIKVVERFWKLKGSAIVLYLSSFVLLTVTLAVAYVGAPRWYLAPVVGLVAAAAWLIYARMLGRIGWLMTREDEKRRERRRKKARRRQAELAAERERAARQANYEPP
jgi:DNA-directed RNA polymerase subunit RPC12/RpoP